jgi:superfamily II RNA helicase
MCLLAIIITRTRTGAFNALEVDQAVALVSTLVYTEKADGECKLRDELLSPLRQLQVRMRESRVCCVLW